jgi:hypothetical protein
MTHLTSEKPPVRRVVETQEGPFVIIVQHNGVIGIRRYRARRTRTVTVEELLGLMSGQTYLHFDAWIEAAR